jgi:hypothetical protein
LTPNALIQPDLGGIRDHQKGKKMKTDINSILEELSDPMESETHWQFQWIGRVIEILKSDVTGPHQAKIFAAHIARAWTLGFIRGEEQADQRRTRVFEQMISALQEDMKK